jgi:hypothetical protein
MIIYTNFLPSKADGFTIGFLTLIRPRCRNDGPLHAHEKVHQDQFSKNPFMDILYVFSKKYRLKYEVEAYKVELSLMDDKEAGLNLFAGYLANNYGLNITIEEAKNLLKV